MCKHNKWEQLGLFERNVTLDDNLRCFPNLYKITNNTKLRDFQFRLLQKKAPTNREL